MNTYELLLGDNTETIPTIADNSVNTVVTSPPYFGLRDYGLPKTKWPEITYKPMSGLPEIVVPEMECCLGLETDPAHFIGHLLHIFRLVHGKLKKDGTVWVNLGDSYFGAAAASYSAKPKDLLGVPWRFAFAMQADGWYLRQDIIWHKPNPMPESVRDRCTKAHEYIFMFSKSRKYYFDSEAIKEESKTFDNVVRDRDSTKLNNTPSRTRMGGLTTNNYAKKNKRSVWSVTTKPYRGAHFATFPPDLIEPCILAGAPKNGVVLDMYGGSGTTAGTAIKHGRNAIICELSDEFSELIPDRVQTITGMTDKKVKPEKKKKERQQDLFGFACQ